MSALNLALLLTPPSGRVHYYVTKTRLTVETPLPIRTQNLRVFYFYRRVRHFFVCLLEKVPESSLKITAVYKANCMSALNLALLLTPPSGRVHYYVTKTRLTIETPLPIRTQNLRVFHFLPESPSLYCWFVCFNSPTSPNEWVNEFFPSISV